MTVVAVVDTETTGLGPDDEPVSIGLIVVRVDERGALQEELGRYEGLREPGVPIHPKAQQVHGLTPEQLAGKAFDLVAIGTLLNQAHVLVAHNATFDARMLAKVMAVKQPWRCSYRQFPWPSMANKKLDTVCQTFGVARPATHGAMRDAESLLACLLKRTGKTERSRTYLRALLNEPAYDVESARRDELARATYRRYDNAPREYKWTISLDSDDRDSPRSRDAGKTKTKWTTWAIAGIFAALVVSCIFHEPKSGKQADQRSAASTPLPASTPITKDPASSPTAPASQQTKQKPRRKRRPASQP